jgi:hypothetical protein
MNSRNSGMRRAGSTTGIRPKKSPTVAKLGGLKGLTRINSDLNHMKDRPVGTESKNPIRELIIQAKSVLDSERNLVNLGKVQVPSVYNHVMQTPVLHDVNDITELMSSLHEKNQDLLSSKKISPPVRHEKMVSVSQAK